MLRLAVLGDPVEHSLSPVMQRAALEAVGLEGTYDAIRVDAAGMGRMAARVQHGVMTGANITMPHKRLAARLSDDLTEEARRADAVNTWVRDEATIVGHNTDIGGMRDAATLAGLPGTAPVLVLGAGGAAAAALLAFEARDLFVSARRGPAAAALVERLGVDAEVVGWGSGVDGSLVVNCTPLGSSGESLPGAVLTLAAGLFETVYASGPTPAQTAMIDLGRPVATGLDLLVAQGARSFTLWTGIEAPVQAMRAAVEA